MHLILYFFLLLNFKVNTRNSLWILCKLYGTESIVWYCRVSYLTIPHHTHVWKGFIAFLPLLFIFFHTLTLLWFDVGLKLEKGQASKVMVYRFICVLGCFSFRKDESKQKDIFWNNYFFRYKIVILLLEY